MAMLSNADSEVTVGVWALRPLTQSLLNLRTDNFRIDQCRWGPNTQHLSVQPAQERPCGQAQRPCLQLALLPVPFL